jgi:hypothetical protein
MAEGRKWRKEEGGKGARAAGIQTPLNSLRGKPLTQAHQDAIASTPVGGLQTSIGYPPIALCAVFLVSDVFSETVLFLDRGGFLCRAFLLQLEF